jgi:hypothetical protein
MALVPGSRLESTKIPIRVSWAGSDPSGIASFQLQQRKNGGSWATITLPSPTATSIVLGRAPGNTFRYRVRATDSSGNTSTWAAGPTLSVRAAQETAAAITYAATWTRKAVSGAYGGYLRYSKATTARARFTFTGRDIAWVSPRGPTRGQADVYIDDGFVATIDLYSATVDHRRVVFRHAWLTSGSHVIEIRSRGTVGRPRIDVDAFIFLR